jgi:hypothetical protein
MALTRCERRIISNDASSCAWRSAVETSTRGSSVTLIGFVNSLPSIEIFAV